MMESHLKFVEGFREFSKTFKRFVKLPELKNAGRFLNEIKQRNF